MKPTTDGRYREAAARATNLRPIPGGTPKGVAPPEAVDELETGVLEGILADPSVIEKVAAIITPIDFHSPRSRAIFAAMQRIETVTLPLLVEDLGRHGELGAAGGIAELSALSDGACTAANVEVHARAVRRNALERKGRELHERAARGEDVNADLDRVAFALVELEGKQKAPPQFERLSDDAGYRLVVPTLAATLEVNQLRRDRHQLRGEVCARTSMPGAKTFDGVLSVTDVNLSSARSRKEHAAYLAEQSRTETEPWRDAIEELAQRILAAERAGEPDVCLPDVTPEPISVLDVDGLRFPARHPTVMFGDGDSAKSYLALYVLGVLAGRGLRVGLADWELSASDHRERLGRLFPGDLPPVRYLRCARPIIYERDRLARWARDRSLDFVAFDSVAYACAGAPESAEVAMAYFQAIRMLGQIGTLHVAHITKSLEGADRRPFGSAFWHNSPRATWFAKLADRDPGGTVSRLGLYPRKWNVGPLPSSVGFELAFTPDRTIVRKADIAETPELAAKLTTKQRMIAALRSTGTMTIAEMADAIECARDTVEKTAKRSPDVFNYAGKGNVVSLVERRSTT